MKKLLILKTGEKPASLAEVRGDYEQWIAAGMAVPPERLQVLDVRRGLGFPATDSLTAIAITGSAAMVTDGDPWINETAQWIGVAVEQGIPILGICFGHQLLAHALGGTVAGNPNGVEVGTVTISLNETAVGDPLFSRLPGQFPAQVTHRQSVITLPPGARQLAESTLDPHQAFAYGAHAWGVQFHPEFNDDIIRHYIEGYRTLLHMEGKDADERLTQVTPSPTAHSLLHRFARLTLGD